MSPPPCFIFFVHYRLFLLTLSFHHTDKGDATSSCVFLTQVKNPSMGRNRKSSSSLTLGNSRCNVTYRIVDVNNEDKETKKREKRGNDSKFFLCNLP